MGVSLYITLKIGDKTYDDAYITFRYAHNLASGNGFVYNVGDRVLGTTTPLFTLVLALLGSLTSAHFIPAFAQWLTGLSLMALSFFTYLFFRANGKPIAGIVAFFFVLMNPFFVTVWGGETLFFLALVIMSFYFYFLKCEILSAVILGLAFLTRSEGILPCVVLLVHFVWMNRRFPWRATLTFGIIILPWVLYALMTFGTPFPSTLEAKMAQMKSGLWGSFLVGSVNLFRGYITGSQWSYIFVIILAFIGTVVFLFRRESEGCYFLAWLALYTLGYSILGIPYYHWYAAPLFFGVIVTAGRGIQWICDFIKNLGSGARVNVYLAWNVLFLMIGFPLYAAFQSIHSYIIQPVSPVQNLYSNAGLWLRENTPPESSVGYFEIGFMGYYSGRHFIDPMGLIDPQVSKKIVQRDFKWAYLHYKPDYLVINPKRWYERIGNIREEAWFNQAYQEVVQIQEEGYFDSPLVIYRKVNESVIPVS
jgi:hypothetical protein